jgi:glycosyltransferase involved in cell wall biosynthesis
MHVAYLVNQYPKISHSFIRREIQALEREGVVVARYSLRRSADQLVTPGDRDEDQRTTVILEGGARGLLAAAFRALLGDPGGFARALVLALRIGRRSERGFLLNLIYLAEACVLLAGCRAKAVDHVHAHFGTNSAAVAMLCRALGGPPYSFTVHGPEEFDKADLLHLRDKIERASFVVAVSSFGRSQIYRHCGHASWPKIQVVHCGVDSSFLDAAPVPIGPEPRLVSVGRLSEQKGQLLLMEALGELHRRGHDFHLTLVGDGELRAEVEWAIARHQLAGKVHLAGWAGEEAVRAAIVNSRALILPSFAEGLPVVIMEALALGRPVVTTYVAGIPELVQPGKNGWLVPAGSVPELVTALEDVLSASPQHLNALGAAGRVIVRQRHDSTSIAKQLHTIMVSAHAAGATDSRPPGASYPLRPDTAA